MLVHVLRVRFSAKAATTITISGGVLFDTSVRGGAGAGGGERACREGDKDGAAASGDGPTVGVLCSTGFR